jgi:hypothetical protein
MAVPRSSAIPFHPFQHETGLWLFLSFLQLSGVWAKIFAFSFCLKIRMRL